MCHTLNNLGVVQMSYAGSQCGIDMSLIQPTQSCSRSSREEVSVETCSANSYSSESLDQRRQEQPQERKVHGPQGGKVSSKAGVA